MIVVEQEKHAVKAAVYGEFTLADYREFEEMVNYKIKFDEDIDLFFDLKNMAGATLDVAWEDIQFARAHAHNFHRIAVVTNNQWAIWSAWLSQVFISADIQIFDNKDEALRWLSARN